MRRNNYSRRRRVLLRAFFEDVNFFGVFNLMGQRHYGLHNARLNLPSYHAEQQDVEKQESTQRTCVEHFKVY